MLSPDHDSSDSLLTEVERVLKQKFSPDSVRPVPSTAQPAQASERLHQLTLPDEMRPKMPMTKDKFLVKENPHLVEWEREVRKFLVKLSPRHGHRVAAVMIYEWATGIQVSELMESGGSANADLRKINQILRHYFGKPYMTYIAGRKVPKAYKIPVGWYIRRHRPLTLTLYAEYQQKTLYP